MVIKTLEFILGFTTAITIEVTVAIIFYSDKDKLIAELKAENARLREEVIHQRKLNQELIIKYVKPYAEPTINTELFDKNYKLSQTLQEIKNRIPKDYKIYQWYKDVMQLITKAESEG